MEVAKADGVSLVVAKNLIGRDTVVGTAKHLLLDKGRKDSMSEFKNASSSTTMRVMCRDAVWGEPRWTACPWP